MKNILKSVLIAIFGVFMITTIRADVNMTFYVYHDCIHCTNAQEYIDTHLRYEYPMLKVNMIDADNMTMDQINALNAAVEMCGFETAGLPIFIVNGRCVQGYGPIEESHPDLRMLLESALSEKEMKIVKQARVQMEESPDEYKAKIDAERNAPKKTNDMPVYWYFIIAGGVFVLAVVGFLLGKKRRRKFPKPIGR